MINRLLLDAMKDICLDYVAEIWTLRFHQIPSKSRASGGNRTNWCKATEHRKLGQVKGAR